MSMATASSIASSGVRPISASISTLHAPFLTCTLISLDLFPSSTAHGSKTASSNIATNLSAARPRGLRDLTGDGIPDYWDARRGVSIGTGAGFASPIPVESGVIFQFSIADKSCDGDLSETEGGLFDIDGDGKPEVIGLADGHRAFLVSQLTAGRTVRAPEAGRLTAVGNGYGASTRIAYRSAKEDLYSAHQVPFPEIVVTPSIHSAGNLGGSITPGRDTPLAGPR